MANTFLNEPGADPAACAISSGAVAGDLVFAAARALDSETMQRERAATSIADETKICLERLARVLGQAGCGLEDIVKINCYLSDDSYRSEFWKTYDEAFADISTQAVRLTQVVGIACGCRVELDAVAVRRDAIGVAVDGYLFATGSAVDPATGRLAAGVETIEAEVARAFEVLDEALGPAGMSRADLVKTTCWISDESLRTDVIAAYRDMCAPGVYPERVMMAAGLPGGARLAIEAVARASETR